MLTITHLFDSHKPEEIKEITLHLPSDFPPTQRIDLYLKKLAYEEKLLREGEVTDALLAVRNEAQILSCMLTRKNRDARGQAQNTRSLIQIESQENV